MLRKAAVFTLAGFLSGCGLMPIRVSVSADIPTQEPAVTLVEKVVSEESESGLDKKKELDIAVLKKAYEKKASDSQPKRWRTRYAQRRLKGEVLDGITTEYRGKVNFVIKDPFESEDGLNTLFCMVGNRPLVYTSPSKGEVNRLKDFVTHRKTWNHEVVVTSYPIDQKYLGGVGFREMHYIAGMRGASGEGVVLEEGHKGALEIFQHRAIRSYKAVKPIWDLFLGAVF